MSVQTHRVSIALAELVGADVSQIVHGDFRPAPSRDQARSVFVRQHPEMVQALDDAIQATAILLGVDPPELRPISSEEADEIFFARWGFDGSVMKEKRSRAKR